ncbi:hypothetical protein C0J52_03943, partial [Blattella germanica]
IGLLALAQAHRLPPFTSSIVLTPTPYGNLFAIVKQDLNGNINTGWWNGDASAIDFTNPKAAEWYSGRLRAMQEENGIDSLKFDAGETSWLPQLPALNATVREHPTIYTNKYVNTISQFGPMMEVRVAQRSQNLPMFVRMLDKDTRWDWDNGLKTLVTTLLQMNMVGYPLVLPDMIGGNGYGAAPSKELFIRWLQANVFMPSLQFSYVPWDFDDETVEICRKFTTLHAQYADKIIEVFKKTVQDGSPANPPIWWIDPTDETAQEIWSEFLLGEDILVAAVLEEGATTRDIYLPKGEWRDELRQKTNMTRKFESDECILVKRDEKKKVRRCNILCWKWWLTYARIVVWLTVGALMMLIGVRGLLRGQHQMPHATFKVLATRSTASVSVWPHERGDETYISKTEIKFSEDLGNPVVCDEEGLDLCIEWSSHKRASRARFKVEEVETFDGVIRCHQETSTAPEDVHITACIPLQGGEQLYGGPVFSAQKWPSQKNVKAESAYVTGLGNYEGMVERYWLMSSGKTYFVPPTVPLFVAQNESAICFTAKIEDPYFPDESGEVSLQYVVCSGMDAKSMQMHGINMFLQLPTDVPDERMIQHPIWSTWARYKKLIDTDIVLDFADEIIFNGFNNSQLEIDDNWEICYGAAEFYATTFPDPEYLVSTLKEKGFRVTLWTHPFVNIYCPAHDFALENNYLALSKNGSSYTMWWDGIAGVVNFTDAEATDWWKGRLQNLSAVTGLDAFKFDAGEAGYLPGAPQVSKLNASIRLQPNVFTTSYVKAAANVSKLKAAEVRVVYMNQKEVIFLRMPDKASTWGIDGGLKSLITTVLAMNMVGYSFVMPDMVGGNGYGNYPTKELFIRWLQANTFMPTIQFSFVPWDFDDETVEISKKFTALHYSYSGKIMELARKKVQDGSPINPPIWWIDPADDVALQIDSEFLLGDDLLVAPILEEGARARDIYLPEGTWRDELDPTLMHMGKQWLRNYTVEIDQLAYFTKISNLKNNKLYNPQIMIITQDDKKKVKPPKFRNCSEGDFNMYSNIA